MGWNSPEKKNINDVTGSLFLSSESHLLRVNSGFISPYNRKLEMIKMRVDKKKRDVNKTPHPQTYTTSPVRSCRFGKGSDNTPRHCSSTGKGITMRPSASCGKSLMKLLSLREREREGSQERTSSPHVIVIM